MKNRKSVAYWVISIVGQKKQFPITEEDLANFQIALIMVKGRNIEKMEAA